MHPTISSLWIGNRLSYIEQLCLSSFVRWGHKVKLYALNDIENLPDGVELADATDILTDLKIHTDSGKNSPAKSADRFRYNLIQKTNEIWVDCDVYCRRPLPDIPYIFAPDKKVGFRAAYSQAILRLPQDSPTLKMLVDFCENEYPNLPDDWLYGKDFTKEDFEKLGGAGKVHITDMPWATWGPIAFSYFLEKNDETKHSWQREQLHPIPGIENRALLVKHKANDIKLDISNYTIHLITSGLKRRLIGNPNQFPNGAPQPGSVLAELLKDHQINPHEAPLL